MNESVVRRANQLAIDHWGYIAGVLEAHGEDRKGIDAARYHYLTAFVHGYKHALEDVHANFYPDMVALTDATPTQPVERPEVYGGGS